MEGKTPNRNIQYAKISSELRHSRQVRRQSGGRGGSLQTLMKRKEPIVKNTDEKSIIHQAARNADSGRVEPSPLKCIA